jgi:hypothetical protein
VIFVHLAHLPFVASRKDDAEDVGSIETTEREVFVIDDFHPIQAY